MTSWSWSYNCFFNFAQKFLVKAYIYFVWQYLGSLGFKHWQQYLNSQLPSWDTLMLRLKLCVPVSLFLIKISIYFTSGKQPEDRKHVFVKKDEWNSLFHAKVCPGFVVQLTEYPLEGGGSQQMLSVVACHWKERGRKTLPSLILAKKVIYPTLTQYILITTMRHCFSTSVCPFSISKVMQEYTEPLANTGGTKSECLMSCRNPSYTEKNHWFLGNQI